MSIRILIADDHSVVRKGMVTLLEDEADIQIVGEASDGDEALALIPGLQPDVLLLDITMPRMSGIEVTKEVSRLYPDVRILVFSMHNNPDYILNAVQNGAAGYLLKDTDREEILRAVRNVAAGELYYPPNASSVIIRHLIVPRNVHRYAEVSAGSGGLSSIWNKVTPREHQILQCLTEGMSSKEIAERFDVSPHTVANQRASIIRKARVKNTAELVSLALKEQG
ncbi:response regulator transcription factor [Rhabdobacter roseus]|uniref:DNA-binding NarL/FixJ family response regulator n=1 Tax=Rhabdobacter roseus TaxID=1655419 RepID=A0A840TNA1_9BACT|nr:response regulator transcription factor [Rhabdobacter roseus]MBB5282693.1 DNA-binding NarL/FixJ family response regulator [Rhabdobacter roseus]